MQFYGVDWLATLAGLTGVYLLGSKNRFGFLVMMIASVSWFVVALSLGSVVFFSLHVRGWIRWQSRLNF